MSVLTDVRISRPCHPEEVFLTDVRISFKIYKYTTNITIFAK